MYLLGYDVGSSAVKACLLDADSGCEVISATAPKQEMAISAPRAGWAEQNPDDWWSHLVEATREINAGAPGILSDVSGVGISYQMHGLVIVDDRAAVLRPSIIWCDSRAVDIGRKALEEMGKERCLERLLNSPGNFTASKLKWVMDNEPGVYARIHRMMLPGDYIAFRLTGDICTTVSGLSEGILWDFQEGRLATMVLDHFGISGDLIAPVVPTFGIQGTVTEAASGELGLKKGTPITYRSGDQPNNALSLGVLEPGEVAATAGTSGVVYGVGDRTNHDPLSRFNTFIHVNHGSGRNRFGNLLCLNGAGSLYRWVRQNVAADLSYKDMDALAERIPAGSMGLAVLPFGNGAERSLDNRDPGASIQNLAFNVHDRGHLIRAAQEGVVYALNYGLEIMKETGIPVETVRAGAANMFQSRLFARAFATVTNAVVELYETDGAQGAARGAGIGNGIYSLTDAFEGLKLRDRIEPEADLTDAYSNAYREWRETLMRTMGLEAGSQ